MKVFKAPKTGPAVSIQEFIVTYLQRRGDGINDPIRVVPQIWTKEGELVAEWDPCAEPEQENEERGPA